MARYSPDPSKAYAVVERGEYISMNSSNQDTVGMINVP